VKHYRARRTGVAACETVPAVIGVIFRRGAGFAAAEDAVQEALIRALEKVGRTRGRGSRQTGR
jgi:DNA-directed RNA polymerase specialized sigma24 family protein